MSTHIYPNHDFSSYAADGCEVRIESPRVSTRSKASLLGSPPCEIYDLNNEDKSHEYEDPATLSDQVRVLQEGHNRKPRKRMNDIYEPHIPLKNLKEFRRSTDSESSVSSQADPYTRESCLNRCLLLFVLLTSVTALILVVLMMFGKVGPSQCACNAEQGTNFKARVGTPRGAQISSPDESGSNEISPPDVQLLDEKIMHLRGNISSIRAALNMLQQDLIIAKSDVSATNNMINGTKNRLSQLEQETQDSISQTQNNISRQLSEAISASNDSFHSKLASVRTTFTSKLNNTAQNLLDADDSLRGILDTINSSLSAQVQSISKLHGPTGPPGFNGSKGDQGQAGSDGGQGNQGVKGDQGLQGDKGAGGSNGTDGAAGGKGNAGPQGDKGDQGLQGQSGSDGQQGSQGPQGAGNFSQCNYMVKPASGSPSSGGAGVTVDVTETQGKKFLGASCSTDNAAEYNLESAVGANGRVFSCTCRGISILFTDSVTPRSTTCFIHYWECPTTT